MKNAQSVLYGLCDSRNYKFSLELRGVRYQGYQLRGGEAELFSQDLRSVY